MDDGGLQQISEVVKQGGDRERGRPQDRKIRLH